VSWRQGVTVTSQQAVALLQGLKANLSRSVHGEVQESQPQVVQVWFEPAPRSVTGGPAPGAPTNLTVLDGRTQFTPQTLTWTTTHAPNTLLELLRPGGRLLIRIHCGFVFDTKRRPFSAALDALLALESLRLPGGVMESWFFVGG
jgi:hypothetical protein